MDDLFVAVFVGTMVMSAVPVISVTIADVLKPHQQASYRSNARKTSRLT